MGSTVLGWGLIIVGILSLLIGLAAFIQAQFFLPDHQSLPQLANIDLQVIAELLDKIARILESFTRLSVPVQWALIGLICIALGTYFVANKPF